jgi:hypothetical protein
MLHSNKYGNTIYLSVFIAPKVDMINTLRRFKVILHTRPTFGKRMIPVNNDVYVNFEPTTVYVHQPPPPFSPEGCLVVQNMEFLWD